MYKRQHREYAVLRFAGQDLEGIRVHCPDTAKTGYDIGDDQKGENQNGDYDGFLFHTLKSFLYL